MLGISTKTFRENLLRPGSAGYLFIDYIMAICKKTGDFSPLELLAEENGFRLIPKESTPVVQSSIRVNGTGPTHHKP